VFVPPEFAVSQDEFWAEFKRLGGSNVKLRYESGQPVKMNENGEEAYVSREFYSEQVKSTFWDGTILGSLCGGIASLLFGAVLGMLYSGDRYREEAVSRGVARYNPDNGNFEWTVERQEHQ
jgi:hypothetical protein